MPDRILKSGRKVQLRRGQDQRKPRKADPKRTPRPAHERGLVTVSIFEAGKDDTKDNSVKNKGGGDCQHDQDKRQRDIPHQSDKSVEGRPKSL